MTTRMAVGGRPPRLPRILAVLLLLAGFPAGLARAASTGGTEALARLEATCSRTRDLSAQFHQTATNKSLGQVQEASGVVLLKRPGKMRWEYRQPEPRLYVTDGKQLWAYDPIDKQVTVQEVSQAFSSRLPLAFLAGDCNVRRDFEVSQVENAATRATPGSAILSLTPIQPEAGIARMLLEVDLQTGTIQRATLFDAVGNTTVIALSEVKLNTGLPDASFTFTPPAGTTVVTPPR